MLTLILGGARSGKSAYAEQQASREGREVVYIATAQAKDAEMRERVRHHRERRPAGWRTIEEPLQLARVLTEQAHDDRCLIVDCLTLWLSNLILADWSDSETTTVIQAGATFTRERAHLLEALPSLPGSILLVSNEVGQGIVPENRLARFFADESGRLNQAVAGVGDRVYWMAAGCPMLVKGG